MAELLFDAIYSPLCDKLPYIRKVAKHYNAILREFNLWEISDKELERLPKHVRDKALELRQGRDGFYAWVVFANGKYLKDFENEYPLPSEAPETLKVRQEKVEIKNVFLRPISAKDLEEGNEGPGVTSDMGEPFCLACLAPKRMGEDDSRYIQTKRRDFYLYLIKAYGTFGFFATQNDTVLAFITFFPKTIARKIGYYTSTSDEQLDKTLTVGCLFVPKKLRGKGLAKRLIKVMVDYAKTKGYSKIEATTIPIELNQGWEWWSKHAFEKLGFKMEEERDFDDGYRGKDWCMQILSLKFKTSEPDSPAKQRTEKEGN